MKTTLLTEITVRDICDGFVYNQLEGKGLFGLSGKLTIQPEYQTLGVMIEESTQGDFFEIYGVYNNSNENLYII